MEKKVSFMTSDGVRIVGVFYPAKQEKPHVLMLHMMPATKESWNDLAGAFAAAGYPVLAIDLRGHGESIAGPAGTLDYRTFSDIQHQDKLLDVAAAADWLRREHGVGLGKLVLIGASIGANVATAYAAAHHEIPGVVALSPGLSYHGLTTEDKVAAFAPAQKLFLVASEDDDFSFETDRVLAGKKSGAALREYRDAGHGTTMLDRAPGLAADIIEWVSAHIP